MSKQHLDSIIDAFRLAEGIFEKAQAIQGSLPHGNLPRP